MTARAKIVSLSIEEDLLRRFDAWLGARGFTNRSNGFRALVREKLDAIALGEGDWPAVATVTYVYDHHQRDLMGRLAHLQHEHLSEVVAATHVHLDHARCLEVLILRGPARVVREIGDRILATRGVERGEVILTSALPVAGASPTGHESQGPRWHVAAHGEGHDHEHDHDHDHGHDHDPGHEHEHEPAGGPGPEAEPRKKTARPRRPKH